MQRDFLELADNGEIVAGEERVKIFEDEQGRLDLLDHLVQRGERVLGGGAAVFLGLDGSAGGDDAGAAAPFVDFFLPPARNLHRQILHAHLLARDDVQNRITGADQGFEFGLEIHCCGYHGVSTAPLCKSSKETPFWLMSSFETVFNSEMAFCNLSSMQLVSSLSFPSYKLFRRKCEDDHAPYRSTTSGLIGSDCIQLVFKSKKTPLFNGSFIIRRARPTWYFRGSKTKPNCSPILLNESSKTSRRRSNGSLGCGMVQIIIPQTTSSTTTVSALAASRWISATASQSPAAPACGWRRGAAFPPRSRILASLAIASFARQQLAAAPRKSACVSYLKSPVAASRQSAANCF